MGKKKGVEVYNDNNATTPEATVAALRSFAPGKVVLIAGGADKGLPLDKLAQDIRTRTRAVVLLPGTGTERLSPIKYFASGSCYTPAKQLLL